MERCRRNSTLVPHGAWTMAMSDSTPFNQLFVNTARAVRAREPEIGTFFRMREQLPAPYTGSGFYGNPEDLRSLGGSPDLPKAEAVIYDSWMASRRNVRSVNTTSGALVL